MCGRSSYLLGQHLSEPQNFIWKTVVVVFDQIGSSHSLNPLHQEKERVGEDTR